MPLEHVAFQLSKEELEDWRSQFVMSNPAPKMALRRRPYVVTEQGVSMLSSVLRSPRAVEVNIEIMRAFVRLRDEPWRPAIRFTTLTRGRQLRRLPT